MVVHVIPPYRAPTRLPHGAPVPLSQIPKAKVKAHKSRAYWYGTSDRSRADYGPQYDDSGTISGGTPQLTVYNIEGQGFTGFSAKVKVNAKRKRVRENAAGKVVNFEVHVDGKLRAQSGLMTAADAARLLVVNDLAGAKELKLYVRWDRPEPKHLGSTVGILWIEPKLHR